MFQVGAYDLLVLGVLAIFAAERAVRWMHRRGWVQWKPRGTSSALGNAVMQVQVFYQPQIREVLEQRLEVRDEADDSGDPPSALPDAADSADDARECGSRRQHDFPDILPALDEPMRLGGPFEREGAGDDR